MTQICAKCGIKCFCSRCETQWIKFKDKLPDIGKRCVVTRPGSKILGITISCILLFMKRTKNEVFIWDQV